VADGGYVVKASADDGMGVGTAEAGVTVDTKAPRVHWRGISPEPVLTNHPVAFRFTAMDDAASLDVVLSVSDDEGEISDARDELRPGDRTIDWKPAYRNGEPLLPGLYSARLTVSDGAGNRTRTGWRPFRDHRPVRSRVIHRLGGTGGKVALTFDDCNDGAAWGRILRILDDRNAGASFFCLGPNVSRFRAQARRTIADGHTIGSHSMNHVLETQLSYSEIVRQNREPQDIWWNVARVTPAPYFRPPYGGYDSEVLHAVGDAGYARTIIWDVDPRDWELPGSAAIADRVVASSHAGSIVVMHTLDGTAGALPAIISRLRAKGLEPVTLDELFESTGMREPEDAGPVLRDPFE
jgi:peptidoglycan/xylan/chitin deacetylase (PgdA/CDA1 family)